MNILMISTDREILKKGSTVRTRMIEYGKLFGELHIIVFARNALGLKKQHISEHVWIYPTNSFSRWFYIFDAGRIGMHVLEKKHDWIITAQDPFETGLAARGLARRFNIPFQIQVHTNFLSPHFMRQSLLNKFRVSIAKNILESADCIRVVSNRIKDSIDTRYHLKKEPKVLPIYVDKQAIDQESAIKTQAKDAELLFPQFKQKVLVVSRLEPEKNVAMAINAFAEIVRKHPHTGLLIAGVGSQEKRLQQHVRKKGIDSQVIFLGHVDDMYSLMKTADVLLSTSNYEGYGRQLVEAAASGMAIITTDVGVVGELLEPDAHALVCPVGDSVCLSEKLSLVLGNESLRKRLGASSREKILSSLTSREEYLKAFKKILESCSLL